MKYTFLVAVLILIASSAHAQNLPRLLPDGEHMCKVSKEYKMRKCRVVSEGGTQILSVYEKGHLLNLEGPIFPADHIGKKKSVFVEASLKDAMPYICSNVVAAAQSECKNQKVMLELKKKGKRTWVGTFPLKHYWNKYKGEGENRHVDGHEITVDTITFTIKLARK